MLASHPYYSYSYKQHLYHQTDFKYNVAKSHVKDNQRVNILLLQMMEKNFEGFQRLFGKFINETGPSVHWDKIERLPKDAVSRDR